MKKGAVAGTVIGIILGIGFMSLSKSRGEKKNNKLFKFKMYYNMLNQWLQLRNAGVNLQEYFMNHNYNVIAIYGMGEIGERLYEELKLENKILVKYAIDQYSGSIVSDLEVICMQDELKDVDAIVVTSVFAFDEIKKNLRQKVKYPILSLDNIIQELL